MRLPIILATSYLALTGASFAQDVSATPDVLFILDSSGSMWGRVNDVEKIVVAKDVMTDLIEGLPAEIDAGLIAYGHRERGSCVDIELIATPGDTTRADLLSALSGVTPLGKTPISGSLLRAGELLRTTEEAVSIVLVSDGIESCDGDPCATAAMLREQDIDVNIHVVGFDVDAEAEAQLSCIAEAGGGEYYQASSADALNEALASVRSDIVAEPVITAPEPEPVPVAANIRLAEDVIGGVNVIDAQTSDVLLRLAGITEEEVPVGTYQFGFDNYLSPAFKIENGQEYVISAEQFGLSVVQLDGTQIRNVNVIDTMTSETLTFLSGTTAQLFAPGSYIFEFSNFSSPPVTVAPNESYVISPSDYALASIVMDGTQIMNVGVIDEQSGDTVTALSGTSPKLIPPGTYRFEFSNFTSPPFVVEGNGDYTISAEDYALATVAMDGTQVGGVNLIDDATGETLARLSGTTAKLVPPGTYRLGFDYFMSPPFFVEDNGNYSGSAEDYALATIAMDGAQIGGVNIVDDATDRTLVRLSGTSEKQIPPGSYRLEFDDFNSPAITVEPNANRTLSPTDFNLTTVSVESRLSEDFLLLQVGQEPINLRNGRPRQVKPGPYARLYGSVELGTIDIPPNETVIIEIE